MPGRMRAQEVDRPADLVAEPGPVATAAPPALDALTSGGNGAMSRLVSGAPNMSVDPLQSLPEGGEQAGPAPAMGTDTTRGPDLPPETGGGTDSPGDGTGGAGPGPAVDTTGGAGPAADTTAGPGPAVDGAAGPDTAAPVVAGPAPTGPLALDSATDLHPGAGGLPSDLPAVAASGIDPALVDEELAEHERWGAAATVVGGAGSAERAQYVAATVFSGIASGVDDGMMSGAALAIGTKVFERALVRRIPVPLVGAVIGGTIGAMSLMSTDWTRVWGDLTAVGEGASGYEVAANTINAVVAGLDVLANVLDTIALATTALAAGAWLLTFLTGGVAAPLAGILSKVAIAASAAAGVVGVIKTVLEPVVLLFRSLHLYQSDADPRAVQASGGALAADAQKVGNVLGGFAGTMVGNRIAKGTLPEVPRTGPDPAGEPPRSSDHPEGPRVEAVPAGPGPAGPPVAAQPEPRFVLTAEELRAHEQQTEQHKRNPNATVLGADGDIVSGGPLIGMPPAAPVILGADGLPARPTEAATPLILGADGQAARPTEAPPPLILGADGRAAVPPIVPPIVLAAEPAPILAPSGRPAREELPPEVERIVLSPEEIRAAADRERNPHATVLDSAGGVAAGGPLPGATVRPLENLRGEPLGTAPQLVDRNGNPVSSTPAKKGHPPTELDESAIAALLAGDKPDPAIARRIAHTITPDPADPKSTRPRTEFDPDPTHLEVRIALGGIGGHGIIIVPEHMPALGYGHGHLYDANGNEIPGTGGPFRGETGRPVIDPVTGLKTWDPDAVLHLPGTGDYAPEAAYAVRVGRPGAWADRVFDGSRDGALAEASAYAEVRAAAGDRAIAGSSALPRGWKPGPFGPTPDVNDPIHVMNVFPINPATPRMVSKVAPQPEGLPGPGLPLVYAGGGPQAQLPRHAIPRGTQPVASFPVRQTDPLSQGPVALPYPSGPGPVAPAPSGAGPSGGPPAPAPQSGPQRLWTRVQPAIEATDAAGDAASVVGLVKGDDRRVEMVDPRYDAPPGTTQELAAMRAEIGAMLRARAHADADADAARSDRSETARRAEQLVTVRGGVDALGAGADTQRDAVAGTAAANRLQMTRQGQVSSSVGSSASQIGSMATLESLLRGFGAVTGGIGAVVATVSESAGARITGISVDAQRFLGQLTQAKLTVAGQQAQSQADTGRLTGDASALGTEAGRTAATGATVDRSGRQADALAAQNAADAAAAADAEQRARKDSAEADAAAATAQARHHQLAADLAAWAATHREQRRKAIEETCARLKAEGYEVTNVSTW